jgi:ribosomal-protein-alanine N-acetyltransferase
VNVTFERIEERDIVEVAEVDAASFPQTRPAEEHVREELSRPWTRGWIAREDGKVVGYLLSWHVVDELHILQVASAMSHRRQGIGRGLVDQALVYAAAERIRLVLLEVRCSNVAAISLYRRVGFIASHVRNGYYSDGEDALEMLVELDPATGARVPRVDEVLLVFDEYAQSQVVHLVLKKS